MRISDWSSDVCSSDLGQRDGCARSLRRGIEAPPRDHSKRRTDGEDHQQSGQHDPDAQRQGALEETFEDVATLSLRAPSSPLSPTDRKSVVKGKSVSVRVELGGRRTLKKKKQKK